MTLERPEARASRAAAASVRKVTNSVMLAPCTLVPKVSAFSIAARAMRCSACFLNVGASWMP
eukprot:2358654-Pyramimonas_sp.AAC.1